MMNSATRHIIRGLFKGTQEAFNASVSFRLPRRRETTSDARIFEPELITVMIQITGFYLSAREPDRQMRR
jgi:hypothetical protein